MAITINFPSDPTVGQQYTYAGRTWQWNGTVWLSLGIQDIQGIQGTQGLGNQGVQGTIGIQGGEGYIGLDGAQGVQGTQGLQGLQGLQGESIQGVQGLQGLQGLDGIQGLQGTQGLSVQGQIGIQGLQGLQGEIGIQGLNGIQGDIGSQGNLGSQGVIGDSIQGIEGSQGVQGGIASGGEDNYVDGASYSEVTHDLTLTRTGTLEDIVVNIPCCDPLDMIDGAISNVKYGYLYNWWVATDARNIAPAGWHVPTYEEWNTLDNYLGGWTTAGGKLKETGTTYWETPNTGATNEVGFNLRGSGWRVNTGYNSIKYASRYWCYNLIFGLSYQFGVAYNSVQHESTDRPSYEGLSLRLIKDDQNDTGTMTGNDGKVYPTVTIGTQVWMAANLMETKYRDDSPISGPTFTNAEWAALTTEAYCIYEDDPTNAGDEDEMILQHNLLGGLQGGSTTERHHHTKAEIGAHVYEALEDGKYYARKDGNWEEVPSGLAIGGWTEDIAFDFNDIEADLVQTYFLDVNASFAYIIVSATFQSDSTMDDVEVQINDVPVTWAGSVTNIDVTTSIVETAAVGTNSVAVGNIVKLVTSGADGTPTLIRGKLKIQRN